KVSDPPEVGITRIRNMPIPHSWYGLTAVAELSARTTTVLESNPARHTQLDLGSEWCSAPNPKPGADTIGLLAHSLEAPVSIPSPLESVRIDPTPVIAHGDA